AACGDRWMVLLVYPERPNERVSFAEAHAGFARDLHGIVDRVSFAVGAGVTLQVPDSCAWLPDHGAMAATIDRAPARNQSIVIDRVSLTGYAVGAQIGHSGTGLPGKRVVQTTADPPSAGPSHDLAEIVDRIRIAAVAGDETEIDHSCTRGPQKCVRDGRKWVDFASADRLADIVQCSRPAAAASQRAEKLKSAARRGCD